MKILLLKDVYNLGRAGDVKKVANGYGRNFLVPQGLAVLATSGALKQADRIREDANKHREVLNAEMTGVAEKMVDIQLVFPAKAGETGKLYGSITTQAIAESLSEKISVEISKRQIDAQPLRLLGMHTIKIRLTMDLIPEISIVVYREGEAPENYMIDAEILAAGPEAAADAAEEAASDAVAEAAEDAVADTTEEETADEVESEEPAAEETAVDTAEVSAEEAETEEAAPEETVEEAEEEKEDEASEE